MPAVDNNNAGNAVVVFYDRRNDASNVLYDEYYAYLDANGARLICDLSNNGNCRMTTFLSDPGIYSSQNGNARFIGDYQAVWSDSYEDGESATAAFIALTTIPFQGDTWFGRVLY